MKNSLFIWIPKTSGTSLVKSITEQYSEFTTCLTTKKILTGTHGHIKIDQIYSKNELNNFYLFSIVRQPYSRAVSLYEYLKKHNVIENITFLEFTKIIDKIPPVGRYNTLGLSQCNPQYDWIDGIENVNIFYFENLEPLYENLKLDKKYHLNRSVQSDYKKYYCLESYENIKKIYKIDFDIFKYNISEL